MAELSVDIGFGYTKYILKKEDEIIKDKFPTAIAEASIKAKNDKDVYNFEGGYYRVGERALKKADITRNMKYLTRFAPLIVYHILKQNNIENIDELKIRSGISLFYYDEYKKNFKEKLNNIDVNGNQINAKVRIFAQGQGVLYDYLSQIQNPDEEEIIVVDIGNNTIDFLYFQKEDNKFIPFKEECFGINKGAYLIIDSLKDYLEEEFKFVVTEQEANKILLQKQVKIKGKKYDLSEVIDNLVKNYTFKIMNEFLDVKEDLVNSADKIIFGGGGAYFLHKEKLPENAIIIEEPEFSNVRGYLKY